MQWVTAATQQGHGLKKGPLLLPRLDSGTHFLEQASLEVMDALVTTSSVPFSDETQDRGREVGERWGTKEDTSQPGGCVLFLDVPSMTGHLFKGTATRGLHGEQKALGHSVKLL